jgi:hypothetical protein
MYVASVNRYHNPVATAPGSDPDSTLGLGTWDWTLGLRNSALHTPHSALRTPIHPSSLILHPSHRHRFPVLAPYVSEAVADLADGAVRFDGC